MKKLVLFILTIVSMTAYAQELKFFYNDTEIHDTVLLEVTEMGRVNNFTINVLNNTNNQLSISIQKENIYEGDGTYNTFCMGNCFEPTVMVSPEPMIVEAHTQTTEDDFHVVYNPGRFCGTSIVKYNFIVGENTYSIVLKFSTEISNISNNFQINKFAAYPNPCTSQVQIQYDLAKNANFSNANIVITNLVGKKLQTIALRGINGKEILDVSTLPAGIYFYSIELEGRIIASKKLIIK